jgi:hypothetical protein
VKPPRGFGALPHVRYCPELTDCAHCGAALAYSHAVWAKPIQTLGGVEHVTNLGFRCANPGCAFGRTVYRSAAAEARQVKGSGYGLDVVVRIGHLRFAEHQTREEIWRALAQGTPPVRISERHVQNLVEVYLALLRAGERDPGARLAGTVREHGGVILSLDGLQPEQGNEQLWIVREVLSGAVLNAANLQQATAPALSGLLRPIAATGLPVLGVVSDAQASVRLAVAAVFPGVPHQLCQFHALREAAEPLWEADRHLLAEAKQELRDLRRVEERARRPASPAAGSAAGAPADEPAAMDAASAVVLDAVLALRQTLRERGAPPFDFAGLRAMDALADLDAALGRCLAKRGTRAWQGSAPSPGGPSSAAGRGRPNSGRRTPGCARSVGGWSPRRCRRRASPRPGPRSAHGSRRCSPRWPPRSPRAGCPIGCGGRWRMSGPS